MNVNFSVKFGSDTHPTQRPSGFTFGQVKSDTNLKMLLGYSDNVRALVNGVEMPNDAEVGDGQLVTLETACNSKAA